MRDLSDNKYIKSYLDRSGEYNLNKLLFGEIAAPKAVSDSEFTLAVHDLLDSVGFALYLAGYKYLVAVTERYLLDDRYMFENAVEEVSALYRTTTKRVIDNMWSSLTENHNFTIVAQQLLHSGETTVCFNSIDGAVEILGAIFKRYFNYYLQ